MKHVNNTILAILVIGLSVVFQVHCAIRGFDLTDEGYLMSIYQWFGTDINYAQGAGGYPLTAYFGWLLNQAFPEAGILRMRLWGILLVTITEVLLYFYLKRYFNPTMVLLGLLLQSIFVSQDPKPFGYNTLTALFATLSFICFIEGIRLKNKVYLLLGGALLGINVFVRLPNITYVAFLIVPYLLNAQDRNHLHLKQSTSQALVMAVGFVLAAMATWMFVTSIGADHLVANLVRQIGDTLSGKSSHSSSSLISKYLENIYLSFHFIMVMAVSILLATASHWVKNKLGKLVIWFFAFQVVYRQVYMDANNLGDTVLGMMNGLGIFGACYFVFTIRELRGIAFCAIIYSLVIPLGSDGGYQTMWVGTWLSLPIGLAGLYQFIWRVTDRKMTVHLGVSTAEQPLQTKAIPVPRSMRSAFIVFLLAFFSAMIAKVEVSAYYDPGSKSEKKFAIDTPLSQGIYTTAERANIVNPLLKELTKYVQPGDTMLVYDSSPMLYYLTQTRPFAGVSWPCVFYGQPYVDMFVDAERKAHRQPVFVLQHFNTSNKWGQPLANRYSTDFDEFFSSREMVVNVLRFMKEHNYKAVWTNKYYSIMLPGN